MASGWGTDHVGVGRCKLHGGKTATHRTHGARAQATAVARQMFGEDFVITPVHNPLAEFAAFTGKVLAWMATMERLTAQLAEPGYAGTTGEQIHAAVQLFERAMDRANTVLATYAKLGIDERLARITEAQAQMIERAIDAALAAAGLVGAPQAEAKRAVARNLRVIDGGMA